MGEHGCGKNRLLFEVAGPTVEVEGQDQERRLVDPEVGNDAGVQNNSTTDDLSGSQSSGCPILAVLFGKGGIHQSHS
jgi:hypothetical protein